MPDIHEDVIADLPPDSVSVDLEPIAPMPAEIEQELIEREAKANELQQALDDLAIIQESIAKTGEISVESIATLESHVPGMLTDSYPPGGYTGDNIKLAMEQISFRQGILLGGILAAIISIILGILKFLSMFFKDASSATASASQGANNKAKEISDDVKAIKENEKDINKLLGQLNDESKITPASKKRFIDFLNAQLQTNFTENMKLTDIIKKSESKMDEDISVLLGSIDSTIALEVNAKRFNGTYMSICTYVVNHSTSILGNIEEHINYCYKVQRENSSNAQVRILEEDRHYSSDRGFREAQVKVAKVVDPKPIMDSTPNQFISTVVAHYYDKTKEAKIQSMSLDKAESFAKDLAHAMELLTIKDESDRIRKINDTIVKIQDENVVLEREGNVVDKKTVVIIKRLLDGARDELGALSKYSAGLIANKVIPDINKTLNMIHRPIRHKRKIQEHILKFRLKYGLVG